MYQNNPKAQTAVEMLTTYSWALLIISIFMAVVLLLATGSPARQVFSTDCTIQPMLPCQDSALLINTSSKTVYFVEFTNNLQTPMFFGNNAINLTVAGVGKVATGSYTGNCLPAFALSGSHVACRADIPGTLQPGAGTQIDTHFTLNYSICSSSNESSCPSQYYRSTGYSTQEMARQEFNFIAVTFAVNGLDANGVDTINTNGIILMDGVPYSAGQKGLFVNTGNYAIDVEPPSGFYFVDWTNSITTSNILNPANQISTLQLIGNLTLTATLTDTACNVCVSSTSSGPECPAICPGHTTAVTYPDGQARACPLGIPPIYFYACVT